VNGADPEQLLAAALAVARQQVSQKIVDLEESREQIRNLARKIDQAAQP
jgi:hypothetical protein